MKPFNISIKEIDSFRNLVDEQCKKSTKDYEDKRNLEFAKAALRAIQEDKVVVELNGINEYDHFSMHRYNNDDYSYYTVPVPVFHAVEERYARYPNSIIHKVCEGVDKNEAVKSIKEEIKRLEGLI